MERTSLRRASRRASRRAPHSATLMLLVHNGRAETHPTDLGPWRGWALSGLQRLPQHARGLRRGDWERRGVRRVAHEWRDRRLPRPAHARGAPSLAHPTTPPLPARSPVCECVSVCVCVRARVCVCERERESNGRKQRRAHQTHPTRPAPSPASVIGWWPALAASEGRLAPCAAGAAERGLPRRSPREGGGQGAVRRPLDGRPRRARAWSVTESEWARD